MIKKGEWPQRRELVIGTVVRVNPYSVFISLEEYKGKEGMVHISEVAGKWVRDIRDFVKVGKKVVATVMNVDLEKQYIALSLKRVRTYDAEEKMREYKRNIKGDKMLDAVARKLKMNHDEAQEKIGSVLEEIFGETFKGFQMSMNPQGYELLLKKGMPENLAAEIRAIAENQMELKEIEIKGTLELKSFKSDGIEVVKKVLIDGKEKYNISINYVSAPKYTLSYKTKDAKLGEKILKEASEDMIKSIKTQSGEGSFKVE
ncbi:MAG: S1 RNA-binding domain-containing protein [Candidatus Aenigmatarchaeota archaeon]